MLLFHNIDMNAHIAFFLFFSASVAVISVKAVAGMLAMTLKGEMQMTYAIFYVMAVLMIASCVFQVK